MKMRKSGAAVIKSIPGTNIVGGFWSGGNYWSDYAGTDEDDDGLGDTMLPYNSSGGIQQGGDWHPLTEVAMLLPDLEITDKWVCWPANCTICYHVTNGGHVGCNRPAVLRRLSGTVRTEMRLYVVKRNGEKKEKVMRDQ
ncbi:MAG: hypothetical protein WAV32_04780 [Halobacteriota archaeon]